GRWLDRREGRAVEVQRPNLRQVAAQPPGRAGTAAARRGGQGRGLAYAASSRGNRPAARSRPAGRTHRPGAAPSGPSRRPPCPGRRSGHQPGESALSPPGDDMACRISELVLNCRDPSRLAAFWCEILGYAELERDADSIEIGPADTGFG